MAETDHLEELMICRLDTGKRVIEPCTIVIFGASGDLTGRKLIPALYHLFIRQQLPNPFRIVGFARREKTDAQWHDDLKTALEQYSRTKKVDPAAWKAFTANISYAIGEYANPESYRQLANHLA